MLKNFKLLGAVAVAGIVATTGSAFTGGGFSTNNATGGFVGGQATQAITGATLASSVYTVTSNKIDKVALTFNETTTNGKTPTISLLNDAGTVVGSYTCAAVATKATDCTPTGALDTNKAANTVATLSITVPSS